MSFVFFINLCMKTYANPTIEGCLIFPTNNIWNIPIDNLPVDPNSSTYINTIGAGTGLHPDFGSGEWNGGPIGIPFTTVPGTQPKVDITFYYGEESDPGPYPIPPDAPIEGGSDSTGDRHVLVLETDNCILYELFDAHPQGNNSWYAGSGAVFDLSSHKLRPDTWTSADAAGLPILAGLVRYDEVISGEIKHAIRFTAPQTQKAHIWPARHHASHLTDYIYPPMGQRFRLKADYDISGFSLDVQTILKAFKRYGIILSDNGSAWFISGVPDPRWDNDILRQLREVKGSDFEAVDESSLMIDKDSGEAKQNSGSNNVYVNKNDENCGGRIPCYTSIQAAINAAGTGTAIWIAQGTYAESIDLNTLKSLTLQGGWDSSFTAQTSNTTFLKAPKATQGSITVQEVVIKP